MSLFVRVKIMLRISRSKLLWLSSSDLEVVPILCMVLKIYGFELEILECVKFVLLGMDL